MMNYTYSLDLVEHYGLDVMLMDSDMPDRFIRKLTTVINKYPNREDKVLEVNDNYYMLKSIRPIMDVGFPIYGFNKERIFEGKKYHSSTIERLFITALVVCIDDSGFSKCMGVLEAYLGQGSSNLSQYKYEFVNRDKFNDSNLDKVGRLADVVRYDARCMEQLRHVVNRKHDKYSFFVN